MSKEVVRDQFLIRVHQYRDQQVHIFYTSALTLAPRFYTAQKPLAWCGIEVATNILQQWYL